MMKRVFVLSCLVSGVVVAADPNWDLVTTPVNDTFNGVSAPSGDFVIAVGENGTIVHFIGGDSGTPVASGTTEELFDVYASSPELAVATGAGKVLLWEGDSWSTFRTETNDVIFTGTWITPEEDAIFYGVLGSQFSFVCPIIPDDPSPIFCRTFGGPMLTACGNSNDIKLFTTEGDIFHIDNYLGDLSGSAPIHDEPVALSLDGIWYPPNACLPGSIPPLEAYAIRNDTTAELWHFDGSAWANMNVNIPGDQTFTWIGGISTNDVFAVGFEPDGMGGNQGVVWQFDGQTWTEDPDLPMGTPGLTDIAAIATPPDNVFTGNFEPGIIPIGSGDFAGIDLFAVAEAGKVLNTPATALLNYTDLSIEKTLVTAGPHNNGDTITFQVVIKNLGALPANVFNVYDGYQPGLEYISDTCGFATSGNPNITLLEYRVQSLGPGDQLSCNIDFMINGQVGHELMNVASLSTANDHNSSNNMSSATATIQ